MPARTRRRLLWSLPLEYWLAAAIMVVTRHVLRPTGYWPSSWEAVLVLTTLWAALRTGYVLGVEHGVTAERRQWQQRERAAQARLQMEQARLEIERQRVERGY